MKHLDYGTAILEQCIVTTLVVRGDGKKTPIRHVTQVHDIDGELIAENDPITYNVEDIIRLGNEMPDGTTLDQFISKITNIPS